MEEANKKAKAGIEQKANKDIERKAQQANTVSLLNELSAQLQILSDNLNKQKANVNNTVPAGWSSVFCEQLRLAYCNKDIAFLEKSYTPNAQVTTGAFDTKTNQIRYRAQGYQQYMANLRYIFSKNKAINVRFETDSLTGVLYVSADGRWQLVRLLQQWQSDRYSDRGYLLLLLCIDQTGPKVHIRVWQPEYLGNRHITAQELYGVHNIQGLP